MIARVGGNELSISTSRSPHFILEKIKAENVHLQSSTLGMTCRRSIFNLSIYAPCNINDVRLLH